MAEEQQKTAAQADEENVGTVEAAQESQQEPMSEEAPQEAQERQHADVPEPEFQEAESAEEEAKSEAGLAEERLRRLPRRLRRDD